MIDPHELLTLVDDTDLLAEIGRRGLLRRALDTCDDAVIVGPLEVDPVGCVATWRGVAVPLTRRETEVLYALALARWQGVRVLRADRLAVRVWRIAGAPELSILRMYVCYLRKKLPGLIVTSPGAGRGTGGYGLNLGHEEMVA